MSNSVTIIWRNIVLGLFACVATAVGAYKLGSRTAEIKASMILNLDDISLLIAAKDKFGGDESRAFKRALRDHYVWRCEALKEAYGNTLWRYPINLDKDIGLGFQCMEERIAKFDSE